MENICFNLPKIKHTAIINWVTVNYHPYRSIYEKGFKITGVSISVWLYAYVHAQGWFKVSSAYSWHTPHFGTCSCIDLKMRVDRKVHRLTSMFSRNVIEWALFFNIVLFAVHKFLPPVLGSHWKKKGIKSRYNVILWTFQPTPICLLITGIQQYYS